MAVNSNIGALGSRSETQPPFSAGYGVVGDGASAATGVTAARPGAILELCACRSVRLSNRASRAIGPAARRPFSWGDHDDDGAGFDSAIVQCLRESHRGH